MARWPCSFFLHTAHVVRCPAVVAGHCRPARPVHVNVTLLMAGAGHSLRAARAVGRQPRERGFARGKSAARAVGISRPPGTRRGQWWFSAGHSRMVACLSRPARRKARSGGRGVVQVEGRRRW